MPPRISRVAIGPSKARNLTRLRTNCPICCTIKSFTTTTRCKTSQSNLKRNAPEQPKDRVSNSQHNTALPDNASSGAVPRGQLRAALADLQRNAAGYTNLSRLQLAIRGLDQAPGKESIRIAILALADGGQSFKKAKRLLRTLLADPLNEKEEEWERVLLSDETESKPMLFKVGKNGSKEAPINSALLQEFSVVSPKLEDNNLEILVLEIDPPLRDAVELEDSFAHAVLIPTINIPTSNTGRYTPIRTPVHKSLVIVDGLAGAATLLSYEHDISKDIIETAVDLPRSLFKETNTMFVGVRSFHALDIAMADEAQQAFRKSVEKPWDFENGWFESHVTEISTWLSEGSSPTNGVLKKPVQFLIQSLLDDAANAIKAEHSRQLNVALSTKIPDAKIDILRRTLSSWSERAHTELRDQLDIAFNGRKWRKLGWWKLFWRVDDVSMIASDIVSTRFLPDAEKDIVFLSGRFFEAGVFGRDHSKSNKHWAWKAVQEVEVGGPPPPTFRELGDIPADDIPIKTKPKPWPLDIHNSRLLLSLETVPALQALAQKLVIQTLSTSSLFSTLAGLMYISNLSTTVYEAGAVASLGIVWSLRRMQGKWETARSFWEGEVREEGRKAVRATETSLGTTFTLQEDPLEGAEELEMAQRAVQKAEAALKACE